MDKINQRIADELRVGAAQVTAAVGLLDEGATVPFIARYRKEKTGGLDDTQLRTLAERLVYLRELEDRRAAVLRSIDEQGKLTPELALAVHNAMTKVELEDVYAPYKPKRRTKAQIAREAGLEPLADALLANPSLDPAAEAEKYIAADKGVEDQKAALDGARFILIERIAEKPEVVGTLREWTWGEGTLASKVKKGKDAEGAKYADYFDFGQSIKDMPSHRALALLRGVNEGILDIGLDVAHDETKPHPAEGKIKSVFGIADKGRPADAWLGETVRLAWKARLGPSITSDLLARSRIKRSVSSGSISPRRARRSSIPSAASISSGSARVTAGRAPPAATSISAWACARARACMPVSRTRSAPVWTTSTGTFGRRARTRRNASATAPCAGSSSRITTRTAWLPCSAVARSSAGS